MAKGKASTTISRDLMEIVASGHELDLDLEDLNSRTIESDCQLSPSSAKFYALQAITGVMMWCLMPLVFIEDAQQVLFIAGNPVIYF